MPYNQGTRLLTRPLNTADISLATGEGSLDVGTLCKSSLINPYTPFKPINHTAIGEVSDSEKKVANYGLTIPSFSDPSQLLAATSIWSYPERTPMYRMFDFTSSANPTTRGYYRDAPVPATCLVGRSGWVINSLNEEADQNARVPFYAFFRESVELQDKKMDNSIGISSDSYGHSADQLASCLSCDDLMETTGRTQLFTTTTPSYFGLALFNRDTDAYIASYICKKPINKNATFANQTEAGYPYAAFNLYVNNCLTAAGAQTAIPLGRYTAVPFLRVGESTFKYVPLCQHPITSGNTYPHSFDFWNGMTGAYNVQFRLGTSSTPPSSIPASGAITTTSNTLYAYVYVTNLTPWRHVTNSVYNYDTGLYETIDRWILTIEEQATGEMLYANGAYVTFDRSANSRPGQSGQLVYRVSPSSFTMAAANEDGSGGGTAVLCYQINNFWSKDGTNLLQSIRSGSRIFIGFKLSYMNNDSGQTLSDIGIQAVNAQTVIYG